MHHVAILRKSNLKKGDDLLGAIVKGTKTIESRWYVNRVAPWNKIKARDIVYFKQSGGKVKAKADVSKVLQYSDLSSKKIREIIQKYGNAIAPNETKEDWLKWVKKDSTKKKRYCILVFLENVQKVNPFAIDKTGYGGACAWLVTEDIKNLRL